MKTPLGAEAREVTLSEIEEIRDDFIRAAGRAKQAGFDGVQLHVAHGYLLCVFLDPGFNKRTDRYGGSAENRFRLTGEIVEGIKALCGDSFPVFIKLNSASSAGDTGYARDLSYFMAQFKRLGIEAVEISGPDFRDRKYNETLYYLETAAALRKPVDIPVALVGGVRSMDDIEQALDSGIDLVSFCRPFICEPDLVERLQSGVEASVCLSCSKCFGMAMKGGKRCVLHHD
jgi:2,4-dienoyl-CoA reductase-like NADH-dependent reductase (Old Yellow Enzyme family)